MRRNSNLIACVMLVGTNTFAACGNDTDDGTVTGTTNTTGTTGQSGDPTSGGVSGSGSSTSAGNNTSMGTGQTTGTTTSGSSQTGSTAVRLNDAQVASVSMTANMGEVQQNEIGVMRAQREESRSYAQEMIDVHTAALQRETALAKSLNVTPADNPTTQMLKSSSDTIVAKLQSASDDEFDDVYLQSQVDAHQMTLSLIEGVLLPSAQAQPLKDELTTMRGTVMEHLEHVRGLVED